MAKEIKLIILFSKVGVLLLKAGVHLSRLCYNEYPRNPLPKGEVRRNTVSLLPQRLQQICRKPHLHGKSLLKRVCDREPFFGKGYTNMSHYP